MLLIQPERLTLLIPTLLRLLPYSLSLSSLSHYHYHSHSHYHSSADNLTQNRGAFGSHVACVLRRLVRICAHYGSHPLFICCSATIANPATHFSKLLPLPCIGGVESLAVIDSTFDGSPHGERYNSTLLNSTQLNSTLLYSTLLYSTLLYSTLLYSTLLYSTLLYSTLLHSTLLYSYLTFTTPPDLSSPDLRLSVSFTCHTFLSMSTSFTSDVCRRIFVIWNPPLKFGAEAGQTKDDFESAQNQEVSMQSSPAPGPGPGPAPAPAPATTPAPVAAELVILNDPSPAIVVPQTEAIREKASKVSFAATPCTDNEDEDSFSLFLDGCEDRPQTLSSDCVGYHRGWQRSRNSRKRKEQQGPRAPAVIRVPLALAPVDTGDKKAQTSPDQSRMPRFRLSSITEMSQLLSFMVRLRVRTLAFCGVRKLVELVLKYCLSDLKSSSESEHLAECVASYRGESGSLCSPTSLSLLYRTPTLPTC